MNKFKALIISTILCTTISTVSAQGFYLGPKASLNLSSVTKMSNSNTILRGSVGMMVGYQMSDIVGIQAEALYSWQGTGVKTISGDYHLALNYLKIPVLAKIFLIGGLNAEVGVSFNVLMSAREKTDDINVGIKDLNSFDFSIPIGINYLIGNRFEVGLRYDISMVNLKIPGSETAKNSNLAIGISYRF